MNEQRIQIDNKTYNVVIRDEKLVAINEENSYWDTESGELQGELEGIGTVGPFCVHLPEEHLQEGLHLIGKKMLISDIEINRIEPSELADGATFIQWEQESAEGLHDTPEKNKSDDLQTVPGEISRRGI